VLPKSYTTIPVLLTEFQASPLGGHSGVTATYKRLTMTFYWNGMKQDVEKFVAACQVCQQNKSQTLKLAGLLQPLPKPCVGNIDFIVGLPKAKGADTIMVIVDRLISSVCLIHTQLRG